MGKRIEFEQITRLDPEWVREHIARFMAEDTPNGDVTTEAIVTELTPVAAKMVAVDDFVFCGAQVIPYCFPESCSDGDSVSSGQTFAEIRGSAVPILTHERVALNLIQRLCGISSEIKKYCDLDLPENFKVMDTRKTTPGLRRFEKYAVAVGGGWNHRLDLSTGILIKDNHLKATGSVKAAVEWSRKQNMKNLPIELEVDTLEQLKEGLELDVDGILLDNMSTEMVKEAVSIIRDRPGGDAIFVEASGSINYKALESYAWPGIAAFL